MRSGWADDRAHALSLMRSYTELELKSRPALTILWELSEDIRSIQQQMMIEFDIPGVRYWYLPECEDYWATTPGELSPLEGLDPMAQLVIELTRPEFLGRQKIYPGVGNNLI